MIICPVCQHSNDDFAITCTSCGSYVQDRVPTIDLFSMIWSVVESPKTALKKIILAEHKNFVLFNSMFLGLATFFGLMWFHKSGNNYDNLFPLLLLGIIGGVIIGIPLFFSIAALIHYGAKLFRGNGTWKGTYGITGWSLVPIIFSVVFILPIEFATLGLYLFTSSPTAFEVKPAVSFVLFGFDGLLLVWTLIIAARGVAMLHRINIVLSFILVAVVLGGISLVCSFIYSSLNI